MVPTSSLYKPLMHMGKSPSNNPTTLLLSLIPDHLWVHNLDQMISLLDYLIDYSIGT